MTTRLDGDRPHIAEANRLVDEFLDRDLLPPDVQDQVQQVRADEGPQSALEWLLENRD